MADIARKTHIPIATGEDVYTRWGFRPILEKRAASILQPDCSHSGGISELYRIAAMAEGFDAQISPHNPLSLIKLTAAVQVAAAIPNFLALETQRPRHRRSATAGLAGFVARRGHSERAIHCP